MADESPIAPSPSTTNGPPAAVVAPAPSPAALSTPAAQYRASIHTYRGEDEDPVLPLEFVSAVRELEEDLKMPVWLLIQNRLAKDDDEKRKDYQTLTYPVRQGSSECAIILVRPSPCSLVLLAAMPLMRISSPVSCASTGDDSRR